MGKRRGIWRRIRRVWMIAGTLAFVIFTTWSLLAFRASPAARAALESDEKVSVGDREDFWLFLPAAGASEKAAGLLFFPGGLVDPVAYAPLARPRRVAALVLIGTSHPRDFSLAHLEIPVTKVYGTRDGLAGPARIEATRHLLSEATHWVRIEGGNHSQFGAYGFQPMDHCATLSRDEQQRRTVTALLERLGRLERLERLEAPGS